MADEIVKKRTRPDRKEASIQSRVTIENIWNIRWSCWTGLM